MLRRRALPMLALVAIAARARADTRDLALTCDTTLAPALRQVAAAYRQRTGVQVFAFPTSPALIVPQLERDIQNDIVVTQAGIMDQAAKQQLLAAPALPQWRNPLVIAGRPGAPLDRSFAVADGATLPALDVAPARIIGAIDGDEVAFLLNTGTAQAGLLHMTDVRANPGLTVLRPVSIAPTVYAASVTKLSQRPNPAAFLEFLATPDGGAILAAAGLQPV